jgi:hypothetical protein
MKGGLSVYTPFLNKYASFLNTISFIFEMALFRMLSSYVGNPLLVVTLLLTEQFLIPDFSLCSKIVMDYTSTR